MTKLLYILVIVTIGTVGGLYYTDFFSIDSCLDRGGCWLYKSEQCEFNDPQKCHKERFKRL
jgi:hypothetical protein